ncbi:restriction endonuclease s subunits : Restriction endonuclease S subunits-like protein OS=Rubrivivax benzoatilyticus JA2 = ATCC BAA-35 GN=RBXJA2T_02302 PE=4 SV=1: Methylase_S [Gemmata massiliana]|uniref:Uncharacterized protein n=1 Tax=Gemmata massiliana TaxID=1210884 RepID=A0A6P2CUV5_9BACT|nr:restriction endonuclease subunit S [Gemmata massiliana]VTR92759.1 restriction endonuclease s subunits : Restriction endonuclease S subunits-like protein OS=Rubrivivax benzoatilyticus JA2 = ATCC BAA-35 GN=RBXJA2T_02302 PE=4 SV=1: Methylase_S [Gemmata massiliana]
MTWPLVPLGEVLNHRKEFIQIDDLNLYKRCRVQLHAQGVVLRDTVTGAEIKTKKQQVCRPGEFLVAEIDAKLGGFGIVPKELDGAVVSSHYFLFGINETKLERQFLDYFIRTPAFREQVEAQGSTNYAAIRPAHVLAYTMPLPSLTEQQRIVARVDAIASRVGEARRLRDEIESEQSRFVTSVHCKMAGGRVVPISSFLELHEIKQQVSPEGLYPQVGVRGFGEGLFSKEAVTGTSTTYKSFNTLYPGALVLSQVKGWEGAIAVCPPKLAGWFVSPEYRTFRCRPEEADAHYLGELVRTPWFWERLAEPTRGVGARRERVRPELVLPLRLPMPTLGQQRLAVKMFAQLGSLRALQAETTTELDALLPSVLNRAFAGQL